MTLHERLTARLDELEALANASSEASPAPWTYPGADALTHEAVRNLFGHVRDVQGGIVSNGLAEDVRLIAAVASPDVVLRGLAEDRHILRRHAPCEDCPGHTVRMACHRCDLPVYRRGYGELGCEWQLSVARRHGLEEA